MKRHTRRLVVFGAFLFLLLILLGYFLARIIPSTPHSATTSPSPTSIPRATTQSASLFVPYWSLSTTDTPILPSTPTTDLPIANSIYFGIAPSSDGHIQRSDAGYRNLSAFNERTKNSSSDRLLTLRMTNHTINDAILENPSAQQTLIDEAVAVAKDHGFSGIVVDLEVSGLPTQSLADSIVSFIEKASTTTHQNNLTLGMTLFGDTFYRARPYDITRLNPLVDQFYVMAYDLHKAAGTPGPNFPLKAPERFGYSLNLLLPALTQIVNPSKITIIFGLYGYDWLVDEKKRPIRPARAIPLSEIRDSFLEKCEWKNCVVKRDTDAAETEINYVDNELGYHVVWFEDTQSLWQKATYAKQFGISSLAFWAWGYY